MDQHESSAENLGADEPGVSLRRQPHLGSERGRPEADGGADRVFSEYGMEPLGMDEPERSRIHQTLGGARVWARACSGYRRHRLEICEVQRTPKTETARSENFQRG